ncbi:MAG TPA: hypothetical protein VLI67_02535, partial [Vicinamibacteria bacterium]|nr:hypothetical protein [Vicinamibacteria bacterium]
DPRAPQNLYPVGALEARLRHLLGDPVLIRQATLARLHEQVTGATQFPSPDQGWDRVGDR